MATPSPRRPRLPDHEVYGSNGEVSPEQALPWEVAERWLADARYYWLATTRPRGRPYSAPIWAVWHDGGLYFTTSPGTATARNLAERPDALVHSESGDVVVILEGAAERVRPVDVPEDVVDAYEVKYRWHMDPSDPDMPYYLFRTRVARTWLASDVRATATRWEFEL